MTSKDDHAPMAGVEVTLINDANGTIKTATTEADGSYVFTQLDVGGPYRVTAALGGFKKEEEKNLYLTADKIRDVNLELALDAQQQPGGGEIVEIQGSVTPRTTSSVVTIGAEEIDELPSVSRDPRDVIRRNPEVSVEGTGINRTLSIGGVNNRFNSITVDGIRVDDDFGLNGSGFPTRRSPIALSAVQEISVDSSPFDVHYTKFLGGNVNIITKSGSNEWHGTVLGTYASDGLLGQTSGNQQLNTSSYSEFRYGATVGGPIIKDKVHFLASVEGLTSTTPVDVGVRGSASSNVVQDVTQADLDQALAISKSVYNFNAGSPAPSLNEHDLKLFGKVDVNIDPHNRAVFSYQRTGGNAIQQGTSNITTLALSSDWYDARDTLNTFSGRLLSDWTDRLSTEVEANVKLVQSEVPPLEGNGFMEATILTPHPPGTPDAGVPSGKIFLGPDRSRQANSLDNNVVHGKAEANYLLTEHLLTAGVEGERLSINNEFVQGTDGEVTYASLTDFMNKRPQSIFYQNSPTGDPTNAAAKWATFTWSGYLQDQYRIMNNLTVTAGVREEYITTGAEIVRNQNFVDRYAPYRSDFDNTATLDGRHILLPRVGVSYLPIDRLNLRGGFGLFTGGQPNVWMSNNYSNDGVRIVSASCSATASAATNLANGCPDPSVINGFDGRNIPQAMKDALMAEKGNGTVNVLDPNFRLPSAWKIGTGADYSVDIPGLGAYGKNLELKANYTFTKTQHGIKWEELQRNLAGIPNNLPVGTLVDGRPFYPAAFNAARNNFDLMLTNDDRGYGHVASGTIQKSFPIGLFLSASYAYQDVKEITPGTSSVAASNYALAAVSDPNNPSDAPSNYERRHRFTGAIEYSHPIAGYFTDSALWRNMRTRFGMFLEARAGQPFSWTFGDATGGSTLATIFGEPTAFARDDRELFYVPNAADVCVLTAGQTTPSGTCKVGLQGISVAAFNKFLQTTGLDKYRGQIAPRNEFNSPWFTRMDLRLAQDLPNPLNGQHAKFLIDIENFGNLLDNNWGRDRAVGFPYTAPAVNVNIDRATGKYIYSALSPSTMPTTLNTLDSVWRISLGLMYDF